jgi:predicted transcriptional regulator
VGRPATGQTEIRHVRLDDLTWAELDEIAGQQHRKRAPVIKEALALYFAVWAELDAIAREQERTRVAVARAAIAAYTGRFRREQRGARGPGGGAAAGM